MNRFIMGAILALILLFSMSAHAEDIPLDDAHFPDAAFRGYLAETFDTDHNGALSDDERLIVGTLFISDKQIESLSGIRYFSNLESLICWQNRLTQLDVSGNHALKELYCGDNQLTRLNVNGCSALVDLSCYGNRLTSLDVSSNAALEYLTCSANQLTHLDVSQNKKLKMLDNSDNQRSLTAPGGVVKLSDISGFDGSRASNWQGGVFRDDQLFMNSSGIVTYSYDCGMGFQSTMTLNIAVIEAPAPPPAQDPVYTLESISYDGHEVTGILRHDASTPNAENLTVRVTFYIEGNYYMATTAEIESDGSFCVEGVGPIVYITLIAAGTENNGQHTASIRYSAAELLLN